VSDEITFVIGYLKDRKLLWKFLVLLLGVPVILILLQYFFIWLINSQNYDQFTWIFLRLDITNPTITAMFFSNYIHDPLSSQHLMENYLGYVSFMILNFICYFVITPIFKRRKKLHYEYPESAFFLTSIIFLLALPFAISGISILFGRLLGFEGVLGFSGVIWAFTAYLFFLIILLLFDLISPRIPEVEIQSNNSQSGPSVSCNPTTHSAMMIFFTSLVILLVVFGILADLGSHKINVFGHLAGFALGLMLSPLILVITQTTVRKQRLVLVGLCGLIILIPSISWLFI